MIVPGTVFFCRIPFWGQTAEAFAYVIEQKRGLVRIRITPMKNDTVHHTVWVTIGEIDLAQRLDILREVTRTECLSCDGLMRLTTATRGTKSMTVFACRECTEIIEL